MTLYSYDENTLSDLHKDARGFRPRSEYFWAQWNEATEDGKQAIWDNLIDELDAVNREDALREEESLKSFKDEIETVISMGAGDRLTALRWMTQMTTFYSTQCVESWVYSQGILFSDYGRKLVKELIPIIEFTDPSAV